MTNKLTVVYRTKKTEELLNLLPRKLSFDARAAVEEVLLERDYTPEGIAAATATPELGFGWWEFLGWINITLGSLFCVMIAKGSVGFAIFLLAANLLLCLGIIRYNKWCFLVMTVFSFNPALWIINGIYLKNRWNHPRCKRGEM